MNEVQDDSDSRSFILRIHGRMTQQKGKRSQMQENNDEQCSRTLWSFGGEVKACQDERRKEQEADLMRVIQQPSQGHLSCFPSKGSLQSTLKKLWKQKKKKTAPFQWRTETWTQTAITAEQMAGVSSLRDRFELFPKYGFIVSSSFQFLAVAFCIWLFVRFQAVAQSSQVVDPVAALKNVPLLCNARVLFLLLLIIISLFIFVRFSQQNFQMLNVQKWHNCLKCKSFLLALSLFRKELQATTSLLSALYTFYDGQRQCCSVRSVLSFFQGEAELTSAKVQGPIARLKAGDYFGEAALMNNRPRNATVTAMDAAVHCFKLSREKFNQTFGQSRLNVQFAKRNAVSAESGDGIAGASGASGQLFVQAQLYRGLWWVIKQKMLLLAHWSMQHFVPTCCLKWLVTIRFPSWSMKCIKYKLLKDPPSFDKVGLLFPCLIFLCWLVAVRLHSFSFPFSRPLLLFSFF